ncbi:BgTH12-00728 [Blumeria graminis f. sp. triticale]|uniref:BgTH12-00728 n=1 Tax=Blumeria graminis f. sp. triticale TaxID=1689686 RepID=A0A9W4GHL9_BLUGR|nr:BgTH12-00728 [Blumeria graminis f. sp. triticale]
MARGHLNLVGTYFEEMDDVCPGAGADLLALISHGVSREVRGETIYRSSTNSAGAKDNEINRNRNTWAAKAATRKHQSKVDERIIIRLDSQHEARKADPFLLRQQVQQPIPDSSL